MKKVNEAAYKTYELLLEYTEKVDKLIEKLQKEQDKIFDEINKLNYVQETDTTTGGLS
jgi:cell division protein FtsB